MRGSGRFLLIGIIYAYLGTKFQSPSLRGSGRFVALAFILCVVFLFQSPSLRGSGRFFFRVIGELISLVFQSPSLRGSGRFRRMAGVAGGATGAFQSPSLRGSGRFGHARSDHCRGSHRFQSPSLRGSGRFAFRRRSLLRLRVVSIPFIAGQWSLRGATSRRPTLRRRSFNPLHCGAVVASLGTR